MKRGEGRCWVPSEGHGLGLTAWRVDWYTTNESMAGWSMRILSKSMLAGLVLMLGILGWTGQACAAEAVAVVIIYDTSGSMAEKVADASGQPAAKYTIANRALSSIVTRLEQYATNTAAGPREVQSGLITFQEGRPQYAVSFGAFHPDAMRKWMGQFRGPAGGTPLGNALTLAGQDLSKSGCPRQHILVVTDGVNTVGPAPAAALKTLNTRAARDGKPVGVHFVAFDVAAQLFDPVKKLGATVVGAADEKELNSRLEFILEKKILLEEEEPAPAR